MKTKREVLKYRIKNNGCYGIDCHNCAYYSNNGCMEGDLTLKDRLAKIGAMAILRMYRKRKKPTLKVGTKIRFSNGKIFTIVGSIDLLYNSETYILKAKDSNDYYPMDFLVGKTWEVVE